MTPQDIEAQLSYAYLHAVASLLSPEGLLDLFGRVARREELRYAA